MALHASMNVQPSIAVILSREVRDRLIVEADAPVDRIGPVVSKSADFRWREIADRDRIHNMKAKDLAAILLEHPEFDIYLADWLDHAVAPILLNSEGVTVDEDGFRIFLADEPYEP